MTTLFFPHGVYSRSAGQIQFRSTTRQRSACALIHSNVLGFFVLDVYEAIRSNEMHWNKWNGLVRSNHQGLFCSSQRWSTTARDQRPWSRLDVVSLEILVLLLGRACAVAIGCRPHYLFRRRQWYFFLLIRIHCSVENSALSNQSAFPPLVNEGGDLTPISIAEHSPSGCIQHFRAKLLDVVLIVNADPRNDRWQGLSSQCLLYSQ